MFGKALIAALLVTLSVGWFAHSSPGAGPERSYVVRQGDTLWAIADRHYEGDVRETVWRLQERNELGGSTIEPGRRLVLP